MEEPRINEKLKRVAIAYVGECCGNAEQSVVAAGYSKSYARGHAHKVIANPKVQAYIAYLRNEPLNDSIMTIEDLRMFWSTVVNSGMYVMRDRLRASELLGKSLGAFEADSEW